MATHTSLSLSPVIAFVTIRDVERAKQFYRDTLGLTLLAEELPFALVFDANGVMLRLAISPDSAPIAGTVLGWRVQDIAQTISGLSERGVQFERFDFLPQDDRGVWNTPDGTKVAWFKDPDGNLLSLSEFPAAT